MSGIRDGIDADRYRRFSDVRGRSNYEIVLVTLVVALTVAIAVGIFARRTTVMSARDMARELSLMRSGIVMYTRINGAHPPSLDELFLRRYEGGGDIDKPYVEDVRPDGDGAIVDPFGNRYLYDGSRGWVRSMTQGYEHW